ncbi:MAG TPA: hypothetical protein VKT25_10085, partial [Ktedonobacteraceae bacterium]|nr:hypothetical protein [Ktedonobacteraceae bacterium]
TGDHAASIDTASTSGHRGCASSCFARFLTLGAHRFDHRAVICLLGAAASDFERAPDFGPGFALLAQRQHFGLALVQFIAFHPCHSPVGPAQLGIWHMKTGAFSPRRWQGTQNMPSATTSILSSPCKLAALVNH